jgi:predicted site-specific integrase-resolvase
MNGDKYISPSKLSKQFDVSSSSLRLWAESGKIRCLRPSGTGRRIYNIEDIKRVFDLKEDIEERKTVCYARVSSSHQKEDLQRQIEFLEDKFPGAEIIKDVGSGLNWKRSGFNSLLERVNQGNVKTVVVTYRDRLCRFGIELVEWIFKKADVKLLVLDRIDNEKNSSLELAEDLLAITTVFVARNNGIRAGQYRRERSKKMEEERRSQAKEIEQFD